VRIIAGKFRGRRLLPLKLELRPTSDRLRETLFDVIVAARELEGTRWLDLYAGSGAVGIEALSRGANSVCFAESSREAAGLIRKNLESLALENAARVMCCPATQAVRRLAKEAQKFEICFLDPPYKMESEYLAVLQELARSGIIEPRGMIIAEHSKRFDPPEKIVDWRRFRLLKQGDAALSFYRESREELESLPKS
jgi:16S rRNA (guanine(966)-N(2))-methyltransferase RsmD